MVSTTSSFKDLYALGTEGSTWSVKQDFDAVFNWDYDEGRAAMMGLYAQGQGDAVGRRNADRLVPGTRPKTIPNGMPDEMLPIRMAPCY